jgi:hypothetical protein
MKDWLKESPDQAPTSQWTNLIRIGSWQFGTWIGRRRYAGNPVPFLLNPHGHRIYERATIAREAIRDGLTVTLLSLADRLPKDIRETLDKAIAMNNVHAAEASKWRRLYEQGEPSEAWVKSSRQLFHLRPVEPGPGIYFLSNGGEIVYIGKSRNVAKRIAGHSKEFDEIAMLSLPISGLDYWEGIYIQMFKPKLNIGKTIIWRNGWDADGVRSASRGNQSEPDIAGP